MSVSNLSSLATHAKQDQLLTELQLKANLTEKQPVTIPDSPNLDSFSRLRVSIAQGYVAATNQSKQAISRQVANRYPITLNQAGAVRDLGRLTVLVQGLGGTSATRVVLNWREIR